ncbi:hypothetical protein, partial [Streptomyces sp. NPDC060187]|uniref:hypothetical protein n=1 Tax=Streptomyces sp. NPDC060187 TaxID=3347067 RepID=UPI00365BFD99
MDSRTEPAVSPSASESAPEPEPPDAAVPARAPRRSLAWARTAAHRTGPDLRDSAARPPLV